jgi:hypothetical protein
MLELRPTCEHCNRPLPPNATDAYICSFECTFCEACAQGVLGNVCPNCGGNFERRPIRPAEDRKGGNFLGHYPASTTVTHRPANLGDHQALRERLKAVPPSQR